MMHNTALFGFAGMQSPLRI